MASSAHGASSSSKANRERDQFVVGQTDRGASPDGVAWHTFPSPLIQRGATDALRDVVYRTTFAYDPGTEKIRFWYSGAKFDGGAYVWRTVYQERDREEVFATVSREPAVGTKAASPPPSLAPPLLEGP